MGKGDEDMLINNVHVDRLQRSIAEMKADPSKAKRITQITGHWNLEAGKPQFLGRMRFESGEVKVEADQPSALGGGGMLPGPLHYCIYGMVACYTGIFASMAAMMGVTLKKLEVVAEGHFNFSRVFGLSQEPALEQVRIEMTVEADTDRARIDEIEALARERCPAVYVLSNPVPLAVEVRLNQN